MVPVRAVGTSLPGDTLAIALRIVFILVLIFLFASILHVSFIRTSHIGLCSLKQLPLEVTSTNISHIVFGIGGSTATWHFRQRYTAIWWVKNVTRGFVWLEDGITLEDSSLSVPCKISSPEWKRLKFSSSKSAVRIARIVSDSFNLELPNVRWFVFGDDDTVFFTENLVSVLAGYDHNELWYIGGNSESVEQDVFHSYDMAFGGGGFALSYPLVKKLAGMLDGCIDRYYSFYGSDQKIWACLTEIGVPLTRLSGFHQLDIKGSPYGLLASHPPSPLISLHHFDHLQPLFPNQDHVNSIKTLFRAYQLDPPKILQQSLCYDYKHNLSISIAWGYSVELYLSLVPAKDLQAPLQTFKTWRSSSVGPFTFNTRPMHSDPCKRPVVYMLELAADVNHTGSLTTYKRVPSEPDNVCKSKWDAQGMLPTTITVSSPRLDSSYWSKAPRRQCCKLLGRGKRKNSTHFEVRECRNFEAIVA